MTVSIGSGVSTPKHWTDFGGVSSPGGASILEELKSAIRQLFITGEQGVWFDPSDFSTLFQDSAGTTPVTAAGQPAGLILDKSRGLVLGPELVVNGGPFTSTAGWSVFTSCTFEASAGNLQITNTGTNGAVQFAATTVAGTSYKYTVTNAGASAFQVYDLSSDAFIFDVPAGATVSGISRATSTSGGIRIFNIGVTGTVGKIGSASVRELPGNHATQSTATSRPILNQDATGHYYLSFDGVDDGLSTPSIDFTATNKMTVVAGVRKLSDAAQGTVAELSASIAVNNGAFMLSAPFSAAANYGMSSKGTVRADNTVTTGAAPITSVISATCDIAGDSVSVKVNAGTVINVATDQGAGNFGNYPLYIGRRGGTTLPFNGRLYGLIVRGASSSDAQIDAAERFMNQKTGAF